jgi:anti-sigma regulatory factor (Ser/Thr protein kinase)
MTVRAAGPAVAALLVWSSAFPATPKHARQARRSLARILDGHPAADDAALCLAELAANAVLHSKSAEPGGHFTVRAEIGHGGRLRVEVRDGGGPWTCTPREPDSPDGRGLLLVQPHQCLGTGRGQ